MVPSVGQWHYYYSEGSILGTKYLDCVTPSVTGGVCGAICRPMTLLQLRGELFRN